MCRGGLGRSGDCGGMCRGGLGRSGDCGGACPRDFGRGGPRSGARLGGRSRCGLCGGMGVCNQLCDFHCIFNFVGRLCGCGGRLCESSGRLRDFSCPLCNILKHLCLERLGGQHLCLERGCCLNNPGCRLNRCGGVCLGFRLRLRGGGTCDRLRESCGHRCRGGRRGRRLRRRDCRGCRCRHCRGRRCCLCCRGCGGDGGCHCDCHCGRGG
mmetsp:Transcript_42886/g.107857  ORF Transcript_42886/g.107857 Transcript_42886/m.107857 type:complete len:211 (-) Transcript_42886:574-1206(-)